MINFRKDMLLLFMLFLISGTFAQKIDRSYLHKNYFFNQEIESNPFLLGNFSNIQNILSPGTLKLDSIYTFSINGSKAKWIYDFDENGRLNSKMTKSYTGNTWDNWLLFYYFYDVNNNRDTALVKSWLNGNWINDMLEIFTNDENGNISTHITYFWTNEEWVKKLKVLYFYDSNEIEEIILFQEWGDTSWVNNSRLLFSNLTNGSHESLIYEQWNGTEWKKITQSNFIYNDNDKLANTIVGKWDGVSWQYYQQAIFEYDLDGNRIYELLQSWEDQNWQNGEQYYFEYNSNNYFTYGRSEMWDGTKWIRFDGMFSFTNPDGFTEHLWTFEAEAYYSQTTDVNDEGNALPDQFELAQNYPNPFNPSTTIKYSIPRSTEYYSVQQTTLKVYDILGREVATLVNKDQKPGNYEVQFNSSSASGGQGLPSGIYFYRLQSGSFTQSRKMILLK